MYELFRFISGLLVGVDANLWVDRWRNQLTNESDEHIIPLPAVFYEAEANPIRVNGRNHEQLDTTLTIYVVFQQFEDTHNGSPSEGKLSLEEEELVRKVHLALRNKKVEECFTPLQRISLRPYNDYPGLAVNAMQYQTQVYEDYTKPLQPADAELEIDNGFC